MVRGAPPLLIDVRLKYPYEHSTITLPGAMRMGPDSPDEAQPSSRPRNHPLRFRSRRDRRRACRRKAHRTRLRRIRPPGRHRCVGSRKVPHRPQGGSAAGRARLSRSEAVTPPADLGRALRILADFAEVRGDSEEATELRRAAAAIDGCRPMPLVADLENRVRRNRPEAERAFSPTVQSHICTSWPLGGSAAAIERGAGRPSGAVARPPETARDLPATRPPPWCVKPS